VNTMRTKVKPKVKITLSITLFIHKGTLTLSYGVKKSETRGPNRVHGYK